MQQTSATASSTTVTSDGVSIAYATTGTGPDVLLVHGLTDSSGTWSSIPSSLAQHYRVTTLDLRGHGVSADAENYDMPSMTLDLVAVVAAAGIENPLVIGHSLGGAVAAYYGAMAAVRGIIDVDQSLQLSAFQAGLLPAEALLRDPTSFGPVLEAVFASMDGDVMTDDVKALLVANRRANQKVVLGVWDVVLGSTVDQLDQMIEAMLTQISAPFLSVQFMDAPAGYTEWLQQFIPHAVVEQWQPGIGHYGHVIDPERFVERVLSFDK